MCKNSQASAICTYVGPKGINFTKSRILKKCPGYDVDNFLILLHNELNNERDYYKTHPNAAMPKLKLPENR
jgi:hypothetical protein